MSCVVAAACSTFWRVGGTNAGRMAASVLFAAGTVVNVAVGRLTFALGLAVGLAALAAVQRRRHALAAVLVVLTAPASPVAAVMLALALTAWALHAGRTAPDRPRRDGGRPGGVAAAVLFPQGGRFPFRARRPRLVAASWPPSSPWQPTRRSCASAPCSTPWRASRRSSCRTRSVPMPRDSACSSPHRSSCSRRGVSAHPLVAVAIPAIVWWQWSPGLDGIARAGLDPSSAAAYHQPLIDGGASPWAVRVGRIEVVPTQRHWETVYVASELPLARGWERQLDIGRNAIFYATDLDADTYHRWLRDNAVRYRRPRRRAGRPVGASRRRTMVRRRAAVPRAGVARRALAAVAGRRCRATGRWARSPRASRTDGRRARGHGRRASARAGAVLQPLVTRRARLCRAESGRLDGGLPGAGRSADPPPRPRPQPPHHRAARRMSLLDQEQALAEHAPDVSWLRPQDRGARSRVSAGRLITHDCDDDNPC